MNYDNDWIVIDETKPTNSIVSIHDDDSNPCNDTIEHLDSNIVKNENYSYFQNEYNTSASQSMLQTLVNRAIYICQIIKCLIIYIFRQLKFIKK